MYLVNRCGSEEECGAKMREQPKEPGFAAHLARASLQALVVACKLNILNKMPFAITVNQTNL
jgi:hypothetical protein